MCARCDLEKLIVSKTPRSMSAGELHFLIQSEERFPDPDPRERTKQREEIARLKVLKEAKLKKMYKRLTAGGR